jgi:signal transduction histidine kinase
MNVKMSGGPASLQIKLLLLVIAALIAAGTLIYTQNLVSDLQNREREIVQLYANSFESVARNTNSSVDFTFQLDIIKKINFPLILAVVTNVGKIDSIIASRNIEIDSNLVDNDRVRYLIKQAQELRAINEPIEILIQNTSTKQAVFYGDSDLVTKLKFYPYLQIIFAIIFILISYISFSYLKRTEQSNIWVGMAKETAHQLGTPISSLMGWQELLKINFKKPDNVLDVANEMENDLSRLNKIASRFSKIGSKAELKEQPLYETIERVIKYFEKRIPQSTKRVELDFSGDKSLIVKINADLFEWVIENLVKNALDAIDTNKLGKIEISFNQIDDHVEIIFSDNGKGIDLRRRKDVFRPGYSTKKRGWGLGLSLAKRIIENYHGGKIFVKNSTLGEGTTFQINLPL